MVKAKIIKTGFRSVPQIDAVVFVVEMKTETNETLFFETFTKKKDGGENLKFRNTLQEIGIKEITPEVIQRLNVSDLTVLDADHEYIVTIKTESFVDENNEQQSVTKINWINREERGVKPIDESILMDSFGFGFSVNNDDKIPF